MELTFKSAGVSARTTDLTGPTNNEPQGIPACVIGTSLKGPAFVPTTVATTQDFSVKFGVPTNDAYVGPLAVSEWLANQQSATFVRVLGAGTGAKRLTTGSNYDIGKVVSGGFNLANELPQESLGGALGPNPYANAGGNVLGEVYFLGAFMTDAVSSSYISESIAPMPLSGSHAMVRGIIMVPSGVLPRLSSAFVASSSFTSASIATSSYSGGGQYDLMVGSVNLNAGRQEFVMMLKGHIGNDPQYPRHITASFDPTQPNYIANVFNTDPLKLEQAGHYLYLDYPIHPALAVVSGGNKVPVSRSGGGIEDCAWILSRDASTYGAAGHAPDYKAFEDKFTHARTSWFTSQRFSMTQSGFDGAVNLFRLISKDSGTYPNNRIKISVENITPGTDARPYGTFDVVIREMTDTDKNRSVVEAFRGMTLDPESDRYIAKVIGDTYTYFNFDAAEGKQGLVTLGDYPSRSNFVRVEVSDEVANANVIPSAVPFGFRGPAHLNVSGVLTASVMDGGNSYLTRQAVEPPVPYRKNLLVGSGSNAVADKGLYWGVQFTRMTDYEYSNNSTVQETIIASFAKYLPSYLPGNNAHRNAMIWDFVPGGAGEAFLSSDGDPVVRANDTYQNNRFSLDFIQIRRNETTDAADTSNLEDWEYIRTAATTTATDDVSGSYRKLRASDLADSTVRQIAKFSTFMQGGFDGVNIFNRNARNLSNFAIQEEINNVSRGITDGPTVKSYDKALNIVADATEVDIQLLTIPGIRHSVITDKALQITENRFDAFYIMDIENYDTTNLLVTGSSQVTSVRWTGNQFNDRGINTSFGAAYFPDQNMRDLQTNTVRQVPPSVVVLGAFGLNDKVGHPWNAPAGFTRGVLKNVVDSAVQLSRENLDSLQEVRINPLASFANSNGVVVWGQKTLLGTESALERVNVRRLLVDIRRKVRKVANRVVFEQGRTETLERFEQLVRPILKSVQDKKGVERFLVKIDTETTTQADINNRTIRGKIWLVPTKSLEFLSVDFVLTNSDNFAVGG